MKYDKLGDVKELIDNSLVKLFGDEGYDTTSLYNGWYKFLNDDNTKWLVITFYEDGRIDISAYSNERDPIVYAIKFLTVTRPNYKKIKEYVENLKN